MSDMKRIKIARKLAYNVFEKTGKIEDYNFYTKQQRKTNTTN